MTTILTIILVLLVPFVELFFAGARIASLSEIRLIYLIGLMLILVKHPRSGMLLVIAGTLFVELAAFRPVAGLDAVAFFIAAGITAVLFRFSSFLPRENTYLQAALIFSLSLIMRHVFLITSGQQSYQLEPVSLVTNGAILILALFIHGRLKKPENAFKN
ncbi:MAG: hypothetical protein TR69_WS6001000670 [candidate division WS6 bacterium OLB20]|uniref:Uncharacterized protein n=1 Tax=candidate division WS6 bacterium OLB20 TaxID=1617426 RepID=A0A136LYE4_9BACT|nr:MAG: hypothetical protein TR69_WS6001000670 [candidate division WS6 bacterium OLB20]